MNNPLGLNLKFKSIDELPASFSKRDLAKLVMPEGMTFDYALPQGWLNQFIDDSTGMYYKMLGTCVTAYPETGPYRYGVIVNMITGEVYE
jgi:hypothetical protein